LLGVESDDRPRFGSERYRQARDARLVAKHLTRSAVLNVLLVVLAALPIDEPPRIVVVQLGAGGK
jgi:hypothetical protein